MTKLSTVLSVSAFAIVAAACGDAPSDVGIVPAVEPGDLTPLAVPALCPSTPADATLDASLTDYNTTRTGTSSSREACDYHIIEVVNATATRVDMSSQAAQVMNPYIVLQSHCNQSSLTQKYFGYVPAHQAGGMWFPATWISLNETTTYGTWNGSQCLFYPAFAWINVIDSIYTKVRAYTKLTYVDAQYVTRRAAVTTNVKVESP